MKLRKLMAAVLAGAIAMSMMAVTSFAADTHDLTAELKDVPGAKEDGTANFVWAGEPTFEWVEGKGLKISGRTANWNALDLMYTNMVAGEAYTLEVSFAADYATDFIIGQADSPWGIIVAAEKAEKEVTLTWDFVLGEDLADQNRVRLQTASGVTSDYYITSVKLTGTLNSGDAAAEEVAETEAAAEEEAAEEEVEEEVAEEVEEDEEEVEEEEEAEEEAEADDTSATVDTTASTGADKASADTGVAGVAGVASVAGLAILATGAIVFSRKK